MSEVQGRGQSSRGRGSFRGGRGGYRGTRGGAKPHGRYEEQDGSAPSLEEQGEVGELKIKYADKLPLLREVCEGWSDEDLVFALQETDGDVELALDRITTGTISQWGEVKKKSSKPKEAGTASSDPNARGRSRGSHEGRGRARGMERGGRTGRGGRTASQANGTKPAEKSVKTTEEAFGDAAIPAPAATDSKATNGETTTITDWTHESNKDPLPSIAVDESKPTSGATSAGKVGVWASLFAKPTPPPAPKKASTPPPAPVAAPEEHAPIPAPVPALVPDEPVHIVEPPIVETTPTVIEPVQVEDVMGDLPSAPHSDESANLTPSHDQLTEKNLDKLPDISNPLQSITVASTTASTQDPMNPAVPTPSAIRPGMSGFAASAIKATSSTGRSASYSRKLMEQQEAVVMPGNHAVDRAAVQFGKMGLNGGDDLDADEEREEPETRTQLPDDSPAAPRASLPPAVPETKAPVEAAAEEPTVQRPAPGLPPAPQPQQHQQQQQAHHQPSPQQTGSYSDQYRHAQGQKSSYDPFTQPPQTQTQTQTQNQAAGSEPFTNQVPGQSQNLPTSGQDYSHYYGANRDAYQQYYSGYGQMHDNQRSGSAFGTSAQDTQAQYATSRPQQGFNQADAQNSGGNTPNPSTVSHQAQPSQHVPNQANYGAHPYNYPNAYGQQYPQYQGSYMGNMSHRYGANRPMFDDVRREGGDYYSQYGYGHNQQYGGNYKSNMYAQPQHQYSHDYSSSPANTTGFGGRESGYGRAGSTQPSEGQQSASAGNNNNTFSGMPDPFGRTPSGFGQTQGHAGHQGNDDQSKAAGPSPSLQGGRPGSALNNMSGQQGLPHPQTQHSNQGFGAYQQYGGFGNQSHQNSGYGNYGSNAAFSGYGYGGRGGWAGYGAGQH